MITVRFDVDDASLRETFLRTFFFGALDALRPETPALWGHMTAQQMVEHLLWTFEVSTGRVLLGVRTRRQREEDDVPPPQPPHAPRANPALRGPSPAPSI
jgi:hypothetical protein